MQSNMSTDDQVIDLELWDPKIPNLIQCEIDFEEIYFKEEDHSSQGFYQLSNYSEKNGV